MSSDCIRRIKISDWMNYLLQIKKLLVLKPYAGYKITVKIIRKELDITEHLTYKYMRCFELYGFVKKQSISARGNPQTYLMTQKGLDLCKKIEGLKQEIKVKKL